MEIKEKYNYNKIKKMKKVEEEYKLNHDTLVTFGDEALTFRKDDPRTQEHIDKKKIENLKKMKKDGEDNLWAGICLSNTRQDDETFEAYQDRRKTVKQLQKLYKVLGREECIKQYPNGFAYALYIAMGNEKEDYSTFMKKEMKQQKEEEVLQFEVKDQDGNILDIPVEINNNKK
tara:strand:- start:34 stop:555 length:522 start_codon:yes stop_codon:yes gene_type:complete